VIEGTGAFNIAYGRWHHKMRTIKLRKQAEAEARNPESKDSSYQFYSKIIRFNSKVLDTKWFGEIHTHTPSGQKQVIGGTK
jgi:hypothetical protein